MGAKSEKPAVIDIETESIQDQCIREIHLLSMANQSFECTTISPIAEAYAHSSKNSYG